MYIVFRNDSEHRSRVRKFLLPDCFRQCHVTGYGFRETVERPGVTDLTESRRDGLNTGEGRFISLAEAFFRDKPCFRHAIRLNRAWPRKPLG